MATMQQIITYFERGLICAVRGSPLMAGWEPVYLHVSQGCYDPGDGRASLEQLADHHVAESAEAPAERVGDCSPCR